MPQAVRSGRPPWSPVCASIGLLLSLTFVLNGAAGLHQFMKGARS
jgi:hypothetical protein